MSQPLTILVAADGHGGAIYADAFQDAFTQLGHTVHAFHWRHYFYNYPYANVYPTEPHKLKSVYYRAQNKVLLGPAMGRLNHALLKQCATVRPHLVFIYRGTHIWPATIEAIRRMGIKVFGYNNDDPFSPHYPWYVWRHFKRSIPHYDHIFAYRAKNLADYAAQGYPHTSLLRAYYVGAKNRPVPPQAPLKSVVTFIGHYEPDARDEALLALLAAGVPLTLRGTGWAASPHYPALLKALGTQHITPVYGEAYNAALCSCTLALVFLSKLNTDTYTRRNFEIPATGTCMVSQYSNDLATNLFTPDVEAVYFRTATELVEKVKYLLANPKVAQQVGQAGRKRLLRDGHEVTHRAQQVLAVYDQKFSQHVGQQGAIYAPLPKAPLQR